VEVYGAERDGQGMPRVFQGYEVVRPDGTIFKRLDPTLISPTSLGSLVRMFLLSLEYAPPGDYEMRLRIRDELSGETLELREPFTVAPAPEASPS
jgi:hypothetical protein